MRVLLSNMLPVAIVGLFLIFVVFQDSEPNDWENEAVFERDKEEPHATFFSFRSLEEAQRNDRTSSLDFVSLNGKWKFHYSPMPSNRPLLFYEYDFDDSSWGEIQVPGDLKSVV